VSNDEMRDHIFQLLAPRYFLRWKQRHQVGLPFVCHHIPTLCWVGIRASIPLQPSYL